jgi:excisionase family DNA binding protein
MKPEILFYSIEDFARLLGGQISKHTVARDVRRGLIRSVHYGRRVLIPATELQRIAVNGIQTAPKGSL